MRYNGGKYYYADLTSGRFILEVKLKDFNGNLVEYGYFDDYNNERGVYFEKVTVDEQEIFPTRKVGSGDNITYYYESEVNRDDAVIKVCYYIR